MCVNRLDPWPTSFIFLSFEPDHYTHHSLGLGCQDLYFAASSLPFNFHSSKMSNAETTIASLKKKCGFTQDSITHLGK